MSPIAFLLLASLASAADPVSATAASPAKGDSKVSQRHMAVLEFAGTGFEAGVLSTITDRARSGTVDAATTRGLTVMTNENMDVLVKEAGKDAKCVEGECEVETARNIGAAFVITGRIARIDQNYSLNIRLLDVKSGAILKAAILDGNSLQEINRGVFFIARDLVDQGIPVPGALRPLAGSAGFLQGQILANELPLPAGREELVVVRFDSRPPGALVRVDRQLVCQRTPCSARLVAGSHTLEMELLNYDLSSSWFEAKRDGDMMQKLEPKFGWLSVKTGPPGVQLSINGKEQGPSPLESLELPPGPVLVSISDPCFQPDVEKRAIQKAMRTDVTMVARPKMARLRLTADNSGGKPVDGDVIIDGLDSGKTGQDLPVPLCSRKASIEVGGESWSADLKLSESELNSIQAKLQLVNVGKKTPKWVWWVGGAGAVVWGGAGVAAIMLHSNANSYPPGDPRTAGAVSTGTTMMIVSNVGAAMVLAAVIGWVVSP